MRVSYSLSQRNKKLKDISTFLFIFQQGFEITVISTGWIGEVELATHTILFNILGIFYMLPLGLAIG